MPKILAFIFALLTLYCFSPAQENDMSEYKSLSDKSQNLLDKSFTHLTLISAPLIVEGVCFKNDKIDFSNFQRIHYPDFKTQIDNYTQYLPLAVTFGLKLAGMESHSSWGQLLLSTFMCYALDYSIVKTLKHNVYEKRPDISGNNSFPSGHTSFAFMNAHIFVKEYAEDNILWSFLAYSTACFTASMRVINQRHWVGDVLAGAGIGLFSAEGIYMLTDRLFHNPHSKTLLQEEFSEKHFFFDIATSYNLSFNDYETKNSKRVKFLNGGTVELEGEYFYNKYLGLGLSGDYSCYRYYEPNAWEKYDLSFYSAALFGCLALPLSKRVSIGCRAGVGYNYAEHYKKFPVYIPFQTQFFELIGFNTSLRLRENTLFRLYADFRTTNLEIEDSKYPFKTLNIGSCIVLAL